MKDHFQIKKTENRRITKAWFKALAIVLAILFFLTTGFAQKPPPPPTSAVPPVLDTLHKSVKRARRDSIVFARHAYFTDSGFSPRKATMHSALLPGWGQIYNKQYWKLPLVYAALGITAYTYFDNTAYYKRLKNAYALREAGVLKTGLDTVVIGVPADLQQEIPLNSILQARNQFRKYSDLSIIAFLIAWGVNVADAAVTAHLKQFDVSDDLSLKINPTINFLKQPGLTFTLALKDKKKMPTLISK